MSVNLWRSTGWGEHISPLVRKMRSTCKGLQVETKTWKSGYVVRKVSVNPTYNGRLRTWPSTCGRLPGWTADIIAVQPVKRLQVDGQFLNPTHSDRWILLLIRSVLGRIVSLTSDLLTKWQRIINIAGREKNWANTAEQVTRRSTLCSGKYNKALVRASTSKELQNIFC